jgi:hypothetical protein
MDARQVLYLLVQFVLSSRPSHRIRRAWELFPVFLGAFQARKVRRVSRGTWSDQEVKESKEPNESTESKDSNH